MSILNVNKQQHMLDL